jgi:uncharacterized protein
MTVDLPSLRKALLDPGIYPDHPEKVDWRETHISIVFLTERYAYKVKKPVDFGFLDFTSLEKRKHFCEEEVRLNRRLSPEIYLGVVGISLDGDRPVLNGPGKFVEFAVQMKRIPEEQLMDRMLERDRVTAEMISAISEKLARFYLTAETSDYIRRFARPERLKQDTDENFEQTRRYLGVTIPGTIYSEIRERTEQYFRKKEDLFYCRIANKLIRDCHGDLRLEHIFWGEEIAIIDCIEFNERFRYTDVAADIGFLAMDLDYHGRQDLSERLIRTYVLKSGDDELPKVLDFYACYRAYVRGKVESFRLDDPNASGEDKEAAAKKAQKYFDLSFRYAQRW